VTPLALATGLQVAFGIMAALLLLAGVIYVIWGRNEETGPETVEAQARAQEDRRREAAQHHVGPV
jgi:hypothetical protein